jgi:predicted ATP-binding protein involved in virulence
VLIGKNGTGKSSVLDALKLPISSYINGTGAGDPLEISNSDVRGRAIQNDGAPSTIERYYPCEVFGTVNILERIREFSFIDNNFPDQRSKNSLYFLGKAYFEELPSDNSVTLPIIKYYGISRASRLENSQNKHLLEVLSSRSTGYVDSLSSSLNPHVFANWFKTVTLISLQEGVESIVKRAVQEAIYTCLPEVKKIEFRIKEHSIMVSLKNSDAALRFNDLSDGYRAVMALAADIAHRMAKLNSHLGSDVAQKTPGIVLIDELDLHLHPKWQRRIVGDLKRAFPLVQFITTTHSPFIIQSLELGEVINLDAEKTVEEDFNALSIEDIAEEVMDIPVPQRSKRYQDMYDVAAEYFDLLEQMTDADEAKMSELKNRLDELSAPFSDDVAYYAFLKSKRIAAEARASRKGEA